MTTINTPQENPSTTSGLPVLMGAATWALGTAIVAIVASAFIGGGEAFVGALVGGLSTLVILGVGTWAVLKVAAISPVASLLAALIAFTVQGVLLLVTLGVLSAVTDGSQVDAAAASLVAVTVVWTTMFAVLVRREEIPLFDLSAATPATDVPDPADIDGPGAG